MFVSTTHLTLKIWDNKISMLKNTICGLFDYKQALRACDPQIDYIVFCAVN